MAGPEPGDRGQLAGLRSRRDLNGRRVEVRGTAAGMDGAPRFGVELLFGAGAGTVLKVEAADLELDKDRVLDPAMQTLAAAMQALAPGAAPGDPEWRDWAGLPEHLLIKVAGKLEAQTEAGWAAWHKKDGKTEGFIQKEMEERKRDGNCLFVLAMVCKGWRKAQLKVGGPLRTRVKSDVILPGRVELAKWALAEGCPREAENGVTMAEAAAQFGNMVLVRWLCGEGDFPMTRPLMSNAARSGNLELVQWLCGEGAFAMDDEVMGNAACSGNLELVRWLRGEGCDWSAWTCEYAAKGGRLEVLQWLRANDCPWDARTCKWAAFSGHLEMLRWAREKGCDWDAGACAAAAREGHLEVLQWLRANGCPWDRMTCTMALLLGKLATLRWARENGCEWDAETRDWAASVLGYTDDFGNLVEDG